jgi:uncharacterized protein (DUF2147 family)
MNRIYSFVHGSALLGSVVFGSMAIGAVSSTQALAADPMGEWLVEGGFAKVKVDDCGGKLWGVVSWEQKPGGLDSKNPDKAKQTRPTLGMPILLGMVLADPKAKEKDRSWEGEIYNSQNGKTYSADIALSKPDVMRVEGCVMGFLCGGQDWTRVKPDPAAPEMASSNPKPAAKPAPKMAQKPAPVPATRSTGPTTNARGTPASTEPGAFDVCSMIPEAAASATKP